MNCEARSGPIGMGFHVPLIIASPWSRGGWVNSQLCDHTSTLMFLERFVHQEEGIKPACALPYELYADGKLAEGRTYWELYLSAGNQVHGSSSAGAPFNVYLRNTIRGNRTVAGMIAATYAVKPRDTLTQQFPLFLFEDSRYSIDVHGPNGFYRSFTGAVSSRSVEVRTSYERKGPGLTENLLISSPQYYERRAIGYRHG